MVRCKIRSNGPGKGDMTYFLNFGTPYISREQLKLETTNLAYIVFSSMCEANLPVKPHVTSTQCKRLGKPGSKRPKLLRGTLRSDEEASNLLPVARQLRCSDDEVVRRSVYINPDLTPADMSSVNGEGGWKQDQTLAGPQGRRLLNYRVTMLTCRMTMLSTF